MKPIVVFYDGWCSFCRRSINSLSKLDYFSRIQFMSFRESEIIDQYQLDINKLEKRMGSIKMSNNKLEEGIYSINRICKNIPLLWIFVPLISFASFIGLGHKAYDWIANRRIIMPTGGCNGGSCQVPVNSEKSRGSNR
ncbi:thiol-disulfide oxidoreductase DCC family protein [Sporosarcina sp. UB5]|uniref:thiol-disulfide oxidoreductase DCC family protein n=1 Tax=Sporosarcina sp. UB5 TaxID=3047463 RepID=UPI003D7BCEF5